MRRRARSPGKVFPSPRPGGGGSPGSGAGVAPHPEPRTPVPGQTQWSRRGGRAGAGPLPHPLPPPQRRPGPRRPRPGARGPLPVPQTPRGSRLGPAPLRLLGSRVAAAPGREGAKEEGRGGEESPAGERDGGRGPRLGAAGSRRGGGRPAGGARLGRPPAGGAGGRAAAVPHHVGVLQASPLLLRLRSEWTAAAAAAPLTGSPGSRSCAVRGGPGAAGGGSPGPPGGGGTGAGGGLPARGFPRARGSPLGWGRGATHALRAPTSSRRAGRSPAGWGPGTPTSASSALLPPSDGPSRVYTGSRRGRAVANRLSSWGRLEGEDGGAGSIPNHPSPLIPLPKKEENSENTSTLCFPLFFLLVPVAGLHQVPHVDLPEETLV